jgi:hypothetical protein
MADMIYDKAQDRKYVGQDGTTTVRTYRCKTEDLDTLLSGDLAPGATIEGTEQTAATVIRSRVVPRAKADALHAEIEVTFGSIRRYA